MDKDILAKISDENIKFSKGQKIIAKYILDNYDKAAFMTAGRLGQRVGVSESTVVRFAAELGYDGYPGMRKALQEMIRNRLTSVQRIEVARDQLDDDNILKGVLTADINKLQSTLEEIDQAAFDRACQAILSAKHIYILGMRSSASLANFMCFYMNLILEHVHMVQDDALSDVFEQLVRIGQDDLFIGISYPRYSIKTVKAMKFAKTRGAITLGITDGKNSPFTGVADINLFAKSDMVSFLDSLVAPLSLINALLVSVGSKKEDTLSDTFKNLENIWSEYEVYERIED